MWMGCPSPPAVVWASTKRSGCAGAATSRHRPQLRWPAGVTRYGSGGNLAEVTLPGAGQIERIPRRTLSDALAGRRVPRLETVLAIVGACEADLDPWRRRWAAMS